jgi:large subunit ribosomal protein L22
MTQIKASLNYYHVSPRKVRLVADLVKGLSVNAAIKQLMFSRKRSSPALLKLLKSAVSNAKNNFHLEPEKLYVKEFRVDEGPTFKRYMPRARGRATIIRKRTSHITLVLSEREKSQITNPKSQTKNKPKILKSKKFRN